MPLLDVTALTIGFGKAPPVVNDVSFSVECGETLALVGESGSGKTLTCRSILRILPASAQVRGGGIRYDSAGEQHDLINASPSQMRSFRGDRISMIFQEPMAGRYAPAMHRLGDQVAEVVQLQQSITAR